ncbi:MAG: TetR/AcrR family transcriptional regulator [Anaerolineales bacterium]|nr:TetR/AcrR family transcriptional regulator [Anaerolineales bacterium]
MNNSEPGLSEQILRIAKRLFINKGYYGLAMREISDELGVSKAALYYHFKDKEQLFLAILQAHLEEIEAGINQIVAETGSSAEQIRKFVAYVLSQPAEQRATIRLASQEIVHLSPTSRKTFGKNYQDKFVGKIQSILRAGMDAGEFRGLQVEVATWALLGMMYPYFYPTHTGEKPVPNKTIQEITDIYLKGIKK